MGWLDNNSDSTPSTHWWNNGPLAQMRANHPAIYNGAKYGGLPGAAAGAVVEGIGKLGDWLSSRNLGPTAMDPNGASMGPPSDMAGLPEGYGADYNMGPSANMAGPDPNAGPAWYENTTMNADDPMGLVPDYGQDGPAQGERGPEARRDGNGWNGNTGVSSMQVNGQNVIIGQDQNQMAVRRMVDFGG